MSSLLEWAHYHLEIGYCPIPTIRGSKGACIPWKPWQTVRPDAELLAGWFPSSLASERNLALVTGAFHRLVVVDADNAAACKFAKLQFGPTPYRVRTSRGMHFYYQHPGGHIQTKARVIPGYDIDVRGDGGMCTGLGSIHASGFVYCLDDGAEMVSVADLPVFDSTWLPRAEPLVAPVLQDRSLGGVQRAERYLHTCEGSGSGGRNQNTFRVAAAVVRDFGLTLEQGWALLSAWNMQRNDPPLPETELKVIVESCLRSGRRTYGERLLEPLTMRP